MIPTTSADLAPSAVEPLAQSHPARRGRAEIAALLIAVAVGAALRAYRISAADFWLDEGNTVLRASEPLGAMLQHLRTDDVHPPLFYLLVKLPLMLSWSEVALRAIPWLCGVVAIPLVYAIARDLGGRQAAVGAAVLAAVWAPLVIFAQEGRMYTLLAGLELVTAWSLARGMEGAGRRWWVVFALASAAALYTHNLAGLFLAAQLTVPLASRRGARAAVIAAAAACVLYLPWLPSALAQTLTVPAGNVWLGDAPPLWLPLVTLLNLLLGTEVRNGLLSPRFALNHAYLLAPMVPLFWFGWQRLAARPLVLRVFLATLVLPPLLTLALSQVSPIYVDKTFLVGSLLAVIVLGLGVAGVGRSAGGEESGVLPHIDAVRAWRGTSPRATDGGLRRAGRPGVMQGESLRRTSPRATDEGGDPNRSVSDGAGGMGTHVLDEGGGTFRTQGTSPCATQSGGRAHRIALAPLVALGLLAVGQVWAVTQQWGTPHEEYALLVRDLEAGRVSGDQVSVVPSFLARPLEVYLERAGDSPPLHLAEAATVERTFDGDASRVWVVTGGIWVRAIHPEAAREFPHPPDFHLVSQRSYPDDGLLLLLYERQR